MNLLSLLSFLSLFLILPFTLAHNPHPHPRSTPQTLTPAPEKQCPYPSTTQITTIWNKLITGNSLGFISHFRPLLSWTIMGTHPLAGHYDKLSLFIVNGQLRLYNSLGTKPIYTLVNVVGGCENEWSVQEMRMQATAKNGRILDEINIWATRWDTEGKVVQVRSYVDGWVTAMIIHENEDWSDSNWLVNRTEYMPGPNGVDLGLVGEEFG
ncbi:hypothetical protein BO94DRAFT_587433 [Aspergillus sclerotioniger CBS 115572]|uniref:SnoaL-like domain-containing protein n=1 Tax=Aspergillus sclerotioniger CBS 115572 TaxID=1450535 RepID=A0A317WC71_9EURO|nr:hypothetical protein BO94DRAFT_587433 [Aspergillus sclerotioniger CBS 115572]PWY81730.1 hypothetical protein BO94DRAFT_587433 [Aspergillus sclerotioniger CBS 115572]